jgi:exonuclease VII small subunit
MALVCAMTMGLAACGQGDGKAGPNGKTESVRAASGDEATQQKFGLYTEAFNKLIDEHWGVPENFGKYEKLNLPTANPSSSIYFPENITTLEQAIAKLKEGRALSGGGKSQRADAAVDKLIPQLEALLAQWKTLDPYFESRAYRDDGLAKAKAAHPALMAAYQSSVAGIGELDAALSEYQRARNAAQIAALTKSGHTAEASLVDAMQKADHFTTAVLEDKPEEADRLLPGLVEATAKVREAEAKMAADAENKSEFSSIADRLDSMVGSWRDYKQSKSDYERESIVSDYNSAIDRMDDVELPS